MPPEPGNPDVDTDRSLVERCLAGNRGAWEELVRRHSPPLERVIRSALASYSGGPDPSLAQDLLQEMFLSLVSDDYARLRAFRWECSLIHYLCVIAVRNVQKASRKGGIAWKAGSARLLEGLSAEDPDFSAGWSLEEAEKAERIHKALDGLSPRERLALRMVYWESFTVTTASEALGITRNALSTLLSRARTRLAAALKNRLFCL